MGVISNWWAKQHGRQLGIAATASGAIGILLFVAVYQLLFLQNHVTWGDYTGQAIGTAVFSLILALFSCRGVRLCRVIGMPTWTAHALRSQMDHRLVRCPARFTQVQTILGAARRLSQALV